MKNTLKVTLAYLAAVIGAGFASGSEAVYYFVRFGNLSFFGVFLTCLGFGVFSYILLAACRKYNTDSFDELLKKVSGKKSAGCVNALMTAFMVILLAAMISAFAEMMYMIGNIPKALSAVAFCILCYFVLIMPSDRIVKWGGIAGMLIVVLICFCSLYMISNRATKVFSAYVPMTASAAVYTAYNSFAVCPVLCEWSKHLESKKDCRRVGVLSGILSFCALFLIWSLISIFYGKISLGEMPMLTLAERQGNVFLFFYGFVVFMAVLSSAVANAYGIFLKCRNRENNKKTKLIIIIAVGWFLSSLGFTRIVEDLYKYVGYAVLIIMVYIAIKIKINGVILRNKEKMQEKQA